MELGKAIYNLLSTNSDVSALVGTKIFPMVAPTKTIFPFIIYETYNDNPTNEKDGVSKLDEFDVRITGYHQSYETLCRISSAIRLSLDRIITYPSTIVAGVTLQSVNFENIREEFDSDSGKRGVYRQQLQFKIRVIRITE